MYLLTNLEDIQDRPAEHAEARKPPLALTSLRRDTADDLATDRIDDAMEFLAFRAIFLRVSQNSSSCPTGSVRPHVLVGAALLLETPCPQHPGGQDCHGDLPRYFSCKSASLRFTLSARNRRGKGKRSHRELRRGTADGGRLDVRALGTLLPNAAAEGGSAQPATTQEARGRGSIKHGANFLKDWQPYTSPTSPIVGDS